MATVTLQIVSEEEGFLYFKCLEQAQCCTQQAYRFLAILLDTIYIDLKNYKFESFQYL